MYVLCMRYARSYRLCWSLLCSWNTLSMCYLHRVVSYTRNIQCSCRMHHASISKVIDYYFVTRYEDHRSMSQRLLRRTLSHLIHVTKNNSPDVHRLSGYQQIQGQSSYTDKLMISTVCIQSMVQEIDPCFRDYIQINHYNLPQDRGRRWLPISTL